MSIVAPKGRKHLCADALFRLVRDGFDNIADHRCDDAEISFTDVLMSAFAMFSLKSPSLLAFDKERTEGNLQTIYGIERAPCDTHMREILDPALPESLRPLFKSVFGQHTRYPKGFVANVQKGDVPARYQSLATYLAKYVVSPPISVRRIDRYDGQRVTYHYRSHKTDRVERERVDVHTFIGRMIQHVFPKGFKRIRYYGVQATKTFAKIKHRIQEALAKVKGIVKGAIKIIAAKTYRERYRHSTGRDLLICPQCHNEMGVWKVWHPAYGVLYDELEAIKRGKYASKETRAAPEGGAG
jgi:hypothetical protein